MSYKAVLVRFDLKVFAGKLVYQRGQERAVQVAPLFSLNVSPNCRMKLYQLPMSHPEAKPKLGLLD